ncbi:helix-turn-helix domain-containing protein [Amycolatopsis thermoflava]|uniref:helix-turn-helix domain-containing protein n=1 Tax=Amycolatopsis thermoflava TaxID=84480 RepID=UPI00380ED627
MINRRLLTTGELAEVLGISRGTLNRYVRQGLLVPTETTLRGHRRWNVEDVRRQIAEIRQRESSEE